MFNPAQNNQGTGICIRKVIYISLAALAAAAIVFCISFSAFAGQNDDPSQAAAIGVRTDSGSLVTLRIIEEVDLGDQGIFPAGHVLATVHVDGTVYTVDTYGKSEAELAQLYGFTLADQDYTEQVENEHGFDLFVNRMTVETTTEEVVIPYETIRTADASMKKGTEEVTVEGQDGTQLDTYEVRTLNGETTTTLLTSEVTTPAVNEEITYGTKVDYSKPTGFSNSGSSLNLTSDTVTSVDSTNGTFTTASGKVYSYSKAVSCTGYAYCSGGTTATGTTARQGAIAVDPSVIPLGSRLFIIASDGSVVYGEAVAEDTGGNIKGNTVDLFYNTNSLCTSFGRRTVTVYVLN